MVIFIGKKAISDFIAGALMVAIVLVVGAFVTNWAKDVASSQTQIVDKSTKLECSYVYLNARDPECDSTGNQAKLTFVLENTGTSDTKIKDIQIVNDSSLEVPVSWSEQTLYAGTSIPVSITNTSGSALSLNCTFIKLVRVVSDCPEKSINVMDEDITKS